MEPDPLPHDATAPSAASASVGTGLGLAGLALCTAGTFLPPGSTAQLGAFTAGTAALTLLSTVVQPDAVFGRLQVVAMLGTLTGWLAIPDAWKAMFVGAIAVLALASLYRAGHRPPPLATVGILSLAAGFATGLAPIYLTGGVAIALYAGRRYQHDRDPVSLLYAVLNVVFAVGAARGTWLWWTSAG